jgi:hypothetical protein
MKTLARRFLVSALTGVLVASAPMASFAEDSSSKMEGFKKGAVIGYDIAVLRTLGSFRLLVGMAFLVPASILQTLRLPFGSDPDTLREQAEILVIEPANFVFRRPLGEDFGGE